MLKNYGTQDQLPKTPASYEFMAQEFYCWTMGDEELKVMLQGMFPMRLGNYDPQDFFRSLTQVGRW